MHKKKTKKKTNESERK